MFWREGSDLELLARARMSRSVVFSMTWRAAAAIVAGAFALAMILQRVGL